MDVNLADPTAATAADRVFTPIRDAGRLIEAEHTARYGWAATFVKGKRVLDVGAGHGHGSLLLAEAGAASVTALDTAAGLLETGRDAEHAALSRVTGDVLDLDFPDGHFDVVVAFELLQHVSDRPAVLNALKRVLSDDGVLLVSVTNRSPFPDGDPRHAVMPAAELELTLDERFTHVRMLRQHTYLTSGLLSDRDFSATGPGAVKSLKLSKLFEGVLGGELFTVAAASQGPLTGIGEFGVLTGTLDLREWRHHADRQAEQLRAQAHRIAELEALLAERDILSQRLIDAEQRLAQVPALQLQIEDLKYELSGTRQAEQAAVERLRKLDRRLLEATQVQVDLLSSPSWKVTKPLRAAKRVLRG